MFNDLNNPNSAARPAVDDIFAETDKHLESGPSAANLTGTPGASNAEIVARKVGVVTAPDQEIDPEPETRRGLSKSFKIILLLVGLAILVLGGYIAYSKFFTTDTPVATSTPVKKTTTPATSTPKAETPKAETPAPVVIPDIPGVNVPATSTLGATNTPIEATNTPIVKAPVDSDVDGLTDEEEIAAGSNPNLIDTDNDGLSDYEEVKIYKTNPVKVDTDGDGYLDGAEVKSGYNPNGSGKLAPLQ